MEQNLTNMSVKNMSAKNMPEKNMPEKFLDNYDEHRWNIIDKYFQTDNVFVRHQIDSFDDFITHIVPETIMLTNPIIFGNDFDDETNSYKQQHEVEMSIDVDNVYVCKPLIKEVSGKIKPLYPNEARTRDLTYSCSLYIDATYSKYECSVDEQGVINKKLIGEPITEKKILIGNIAVPLKSKFCHLHGMNEYMLKEKGEDIYETGGYFIVKGSEKTVVAQERPADNVVYVFTKKPKEDYAEIRSSIDQRFYPVKTTGVYYAYDNRDKKEKSKNRLPNTFEVSIQNVKRRLPLFLVMKALGVQADKEMFGLILYNLNDTTAFNYFMPSYNDFEQFNIKSADDALLFIANNLSFTLPVFVKKLDQDSKKATGDIQLRLQEKYQQELKRIVTDLLINNLFPHVGKDFRNKAYFLGHMTNELLHSIMGKRNYDDRDSYVNKRLDTTGLLMNQIFRGAWQTTVKNIVAKMKKDLDNITNIRNLIQKMSTIEKKFRVSLSTGNWAVKSSPLQESKKGIAQLLQRLSRLSTISFLRKINTPITNSKLVPPRKLHGTQWGIVCCNESPDGQQIGVAKHLAMFSNPTIDTNNTNIIVFNLLLQNGMRSLDEIDYSDVIYYATKVFINGNWVGIIKDETGTTGTTGTGVKLGTKTNKILNYLKQQKRIRTFNPQSSISWNTRQNKLIILTDSGRLTRPVFIVNTGEENTGEGELVIAHQWNTYKNRFSYPDITWENLVFGTLSPMEANDRAQKQKTETQTSSQSGYDPIIEYIDVDEESNSLIALDAHVLEENMKQKKAGNCYKKYNYCEIHPIGIMGILSSNFPYSDHNQSPRNILQSAMGKQATGIYTTNYKLRMDTDGKSVLCYPQRPIVMTKLAKYIHLDDLPQTTEVIFAIMSYKGYGQEDAVILNKSSIQRGLFNSLYYRTYKDELKTKSTSFVGEKYANPVLGNATRLKHGSYNALSDTGFPKMGARVESGDILIGKVIPVEKAKGVRVTKDISIVVKPNERGIVDRIVPSAEFPNNINGEGQIFTKVRTVQLRVPEIGDKYASRYAQKGVNSVQFRYEDLPRTASGIVPDVIMNPHAVPSRMTIGLLIECIVSKLGLTVGEFYDGTPFSEVNIQTIGDKLEKLGMNRYGNEVMYNGLTGEKMPVEIFICPCAYQRLKHMVQDKIHCLTLDHEVLTADGWKFFENLSMSDKIATLKDGSVVYDNPTELLYYPHYQGLMYHIKTDLIDLNVTPNHRMWVSIPIENGRPADSIIVTRNEISTENWSPFCLIETEKLIGKRVRYLTADGRSSDTYNNLNVEEITNGEITPVFCLQVPSEVFCVRRNGLTVWTGNSRETGATQILTRQPAEGRSREGGMRFGEQERDAMISHGATQILKSKFMDDSDFFKVFVGTKTHDIAISNPELGIKKYGQKDIVDEDLVEVQIPYATKLLMQEMNARGIDTQIYTETAF